MKEIKKVCFFEEECQGKVQVSETSGLRRLPPSGSGSGSGDIRNNGTEFGSGSIMSSNGGSWNASCSFSWDASFKVNKNHALSYVRIQVANISISCNGVSFGSKTEGTIYVPYMCNFLITSHSYSDSSFGSFEISSPIRFYASLSGQQFYVDKITYDEKGEMLRSEKLSESKEVVVAFEFSFDERNLKIRFESCGVSAM